jgi:hypothetical protein
MSSWGENFLLRSIDLSRDEELNFAHSRYFDELPVRDAGEVSLVSSARDIYRE